MARFDLRFASSVRKDLKKIHKKDVAKILSGIQALTEDPRPTQCKKLTNEELYRLRIGNYRVIYEVLDDVLLVHVIKFGHRKDVYKN